MATRRRRRRSRSRRNSPVAYNPPRRGRRRRRRNPPFGGRRAVNVRNIMSMATQGVVDAGEAIIGKGVVRLVRGRLGQEGNTTTGSITEALAAIAGGYVAARINPNFGKMFVAGGFMAPMETIVKQLNIPFLSPALGDEGALTFIDGGSVGSYELPDGTSSGAVPGAVGEYAFEQ